MKLNHGLAPAAGQVPVGDGESAWRQGTSQRVLLIRRTVRSGQRIVFPGDLVVLGDVNPGAELIAGGDVLVLGLLRGVAHAGAEGSEEAVVAAFRLRPTQLRIGSLVSRPPDTGPGAPDLPEVARVVDGIIVIEALERSIFRT
ncbi:MAG: septum site-determining protein MinC [Bacillota bacterium]